MQYMLGEVREIGSRESEIHNACNLLFDLLSCRKQIEETAGNTSAFAIRQPHFANEVVCRIGPSC